MCLYFYMPIYEAKENINNKNQEKFGIISIKSIRILKIILKTSFIKKKKKNYRKLIFIASILKKRYKQK